MVNKAEYSKCQLCPNLCKVNRNNGEVGICGETNKVRVAWAGLHKGEEPPISGKNGSGMIFFSGCPLKCKYCQNYQISNNGRNNIGITLTENELANLMLSLEKQGAFSLNLVTATHFIPSVIEALEIARKNGLTLKVVWNSSGYESVDALKTIDKYIDLYLLDYKTRSHKVASVFCGREKYVDYIDDVFSFVKERRKKTDLSAINGVIFRHLVFPGTVNASKNVIRRFSKEYKENFVLSLMFQFVSPFEERFPSITEEEYQSLIEVLEEENIEDGFIQDIDEEEFLWLPDFNKDNPFPASFASPNPYFLGLKKERLK